MGNVTADSEQGGKLWEARRKAPAVHNLGDEFQNEFTSVKKPSLETSNTLDSTVIFDRYSHPQGVNKENVA